MLTAAKKLLDNQYSEIAIHFLFVLQAITTLLYMLALAEPFVTQQTVYADYLKMFLIAAKCEALVFV